jgi:hypothetical protein
MKVAVKVQNKDIVISVDVTAYYTGIRGLVVHKEIGHVNDDTTLTFTHKWTLTHVTSGKKLFTGKKEQLVIIARVLGDSDWTRSEKNIEEDVAGNTFRMIKAQLDNCSFAYYWKTCDNCKIRFTCYTNRQFLRKEE